MKPAFYFGLGSWIISGLGSVLVVGSFIVVLLIAIPHGGGDSNLIVSALIGALLCFIVSLVPAALAGVIFSFALVRARRESSMTQRRALALGLASSFIAVAITSVAGFAYLANRLPSSRSIHIDELLNVWLSVVYAVLLSAIGLLLVFSFASAYYKRRG